MYNYIAMIVGLIVFFVGFWFLAKSRGENECGGTYANANYGGGIAGIVLGTIVLGVGIYLTKTGL